MICNALKCMYLYYPSEAGYMNHLVIIISKLGVSTIFHGKMFTLWGYMKSYTFDGFLVCNLSHQNDLIFGYVLVPTTYFSEDPPRSENL